MHCPVCQATALEKDANCRVCGSALTAICTKCQSANPLSARYCNFCGEQLARAPAPVERKIVTVLFADIVGSTELIGEQDPEKALSYLAPALTMMGTAVRQSNGAIMNTMGDGIMALFGVPNAQENHALLACQAAFAMRQSSAGNNLRLRIGIHSGEVVFGLTQGLTGEQSAYGAAIHLASRLEQMATPGDICITEATFRLVRPYCDAVSLGQRMVRGFSHPIGLYRLLGLKPASTSQQFRDVILTAYRGRDQELQYLNDALLQANGGNGIAVGISAAPGLGKSRLCFEFAERCRTQLVPVIEARASPYGYSGPLQPLLEFLRAYFRILPDDDPKMARERIASQIETLDPSLRSDVPVLAEILGVAEPGKARPENDPKAKHARLVKAISNLVREGARTPTVIIVEDIHWLDEGSREFISALVESVTGTSNLLLLTYRPGDETSWRNLPNFRELALADLDRDEICRLVAELIGTHPSIGAVFERIVERSNGNPFFAEELVRVLVDQGALLGEPGQYVANDLELTEGLPTTVQSVIGARIDRLQDADKAVLQIGATVGREFPLPVLEEVSGLAREKLVGILDRLCDLELLRDDQHGTFGFRHPLIQEVAYAMQLKKRRAELHAAVAKALERFHHKRLDEYADLISYHFEAAGDAGTAANYGARAALWIGTTHSRQALKSWRRVHALLQHQPRSAGLDTLRMMACGKIMGFGWREGMDANEAEPFAREAVALARENRNVNAEILLVAAYGRIIAATGSADTYVYYLQQALALTGSENRGPQALLHAVLCQAFSFAGRLREALAAATTALDDIAHIDAFQQQMLGFDAGRWVESLKARILVRMGDFAAARSTIAQLIATEVDHRDPAVQYIPHLAAVELAWLVDDAALARAHSRRISDIARSSEIPYLSVYAGRCEALADALEGNQTGAIDRLEHTLMLARDARAALEHEPDIVADLAEIYLRSGRAESTVATARSAIAIARDRCSRLAECRATITLAAALASSDATGRLSEAERLLRHAGALVAETGADAYRPSLDTASRSLASRAELEK